MPDTVIRHVDVAGDCGPFASGMCKTITRGPAPIARREDGGQFILASELLFNHNQQISALVVDPAKMVFLADFLRRKEDNMSRPLNDHLAQLVAKDAISVRDALRAAYQRMELHEQLQSSMNR
ncbi:hypothetical protein [Burkholderia ambifaria]|uniref:hypothetical protein n=1 Tax=Burkholderia ambifaria TaxID=152480 RepID=UPI001588A0C0|nr:hypothetical protein [Burkholderia ambifaria]